MFLLLSIVYLGSKYYGRRPYTQNSCLIFLGILGNPGLHIHTQHSMVGTREQTCLVMMVRNKDTHIFVKL